MRLIKHLSEQIEDEVCGVIEYAKDALEYKSTRPQLADMYYKLAVTENNHVTMLHDAVVKIVEEAQNKNVEVPQFMLNKWEAKHRKMIEKMAEAKVYLSMYKQCILISLKVKVRTPHPPKSADFFFFLLDIKNILQIEKYLI